MTSLANHNDGDHVKNKTMEIVSDSFSPLQIYSELIQSKMLLRINDKKCIYLFDGFKHSAVLMELGRLREISFRLVGEGTGNRIDVDSYDYYYQHIILWDEENLEIMGSYRIGNASQIIKRFGIEGLYSSSLYLYMEKSYEYLSQGLELGRSFLQQKYWGKRGLDYLWRGIGAYLAQNQNIRYLFGPISLSAAYPSLATNLIVAYYQYFYQFDVTQSIAIARIPFAVNQEVLNYVIEKYPQNNEMSFKKLKIDLQNLDVKIPPLYKQYTDLCNFDGIRFLSFSVDPSFNYAIDGLIVVDLKFLKDQKRKKYITNIMEKEMQKSS
jgi:hypothetical protein